LIDISSTISADITSSDDTIPLATGDGSKFPISGTIIIDTEKITYTGISTDSLTGCSRGVDDSTAVNHSSGAEVHTTVFEISGAHEGSNPTWYVQQWNTDMFAESNGKIFKYRGPIDGSSLGRNLFLPQLDVVNRAKITYLYGYDSIQTTITRLTVLLAKRQLMQDNISKALIAGRNEFNPEMFNADLEEIERIASSYRQLSMMNT